MVHKTLGLPRALLSVECIKIFTEKQLLKFWEKYRVSTPGSANEWTLSTAGTRKLILSCFTLENKDEWIKRAKEYTGKPKYPFLLQPPGVQDMIFGMLETNTEGKLFINQLAKNLAFHLIRNNLEGGMR